MVQEITKLIKRQEVRHPEKVNKTTSPIKRKPDWIRVKAPNSKTYHETRDLMREWKLTTVCEEAACPNIGECWSKKHATMMILGGICTRACAFCNVTTGRPNAVDLLEPENVAEAVFRLGLEHVVITSVDRDDLADGGASHFAATIKAVKRLSPGTTVEILTPDFLRKDDALETVVEAEPDVFNHNLETVPRLQREIRTAASYGRSLSLLEYVKKQGFMGKTKTGLIVGMGETKEEVISVLKVAVKVV